MNVDATLQLKDIATILLSSAALITSMSVALMNVGWQRDKKRADLRAEFEKAILGISEARSDLEKLRQEFGEKFDEMDAQARRNLIHDRRNFFVSKAAHLMKQSLVEVNAFDNLLMAAALIDSGRVADSLHYYRRSVEMAEDEYEKATSERVYGRALILSGDRSSGRSRMLAAIDIFRTLALHEGYDPERMRSEAAETCRRLVAAEDQKDTVMEEDVALLDELSSTIMSPGRRKLFQDFASQVRKQHNLHPVRRVKRRSVKIVRDSA